MVYRAQIENLESHLAAGNEAVINQLPHSIERNCLYSLQKLKPIRSIM